MLTSASPRLQLPLRTHLIGLVLVALLPLLVFAGISTWLVAEAQNREARQNLKSVTHAIAAAVDGKVTTLLTSLQIMAASEDFERADLRALYQRIRRAAHSQSAWQAISLVSTSGQEIFHSERPFGEALPSLADVEVFQAALHSPDPVVSGFREGRTSGVSVVSVAVPVIRAKKTIFVLMGSILVQEFSDLINDQHLPPAWTIALLDQDYRILARNRSPDRYVGQTATPSLQHFLGRADEDIFEDINQEGRPSLGAFSRAPLTGYTVVIGFPDRRIQRPTERALSYLLAGGAFLLLSGIFLAWLYGRRIARALVLLSQSADALGRGELVSPGFSDVIEVNAISEALRDAATERVRAEAALKETNQRAQEAIAQRDTFLSVASHELKTPVTSLLLQLQLLQRRLRAPNGTASPEELSRPADLMQAQVKRLTRLVDELLDVSRIASGRLEFRPEPMDFAAFLRDLAAHFEAESARTGSRLTLDVPDALPGTWDPHRLDHIVTNLVTNAFKYGSGQPIVIAARDLGAEVEITVSDQGIGIAPEHHARIFQRFERAVGERNYGGLGLGLWIVQRLVDAAGGTIAVASAPGAGSRFAVRLPREIGGRPVDAFRADESFPAQ